MLRNVVSSKDRKLEMWHFWTTSTALGGISGYEVAKISTGAIIMVPFEGYGPQSPSTENPCDVSEIASMRFTCNMPQKL